MFNTIYIRDTDRYEDMFQLQDGIIDKSDGEEVEEFFQYFIVNEGKIMLKNIR